MHRTCLGPLREEADPKVKLTHTAQSLVISKIPQPLQDLFGGPVREEVDPELYDIFLLPPGEDPETCQSWLRMRNRWGWRMQVLRCAVPCAVHSLKLPSARPRSDPSCPQQCLLSHGPHACRDGRYSLVFEEWVTGGWPGAQES